MAENCESTLSNVLRMRTRRNSRLKNHEMMCNLNSYVDLISCVNLCAIQQPGCLSVNHENLAGKCELNYATCDGYDIVANDGYSCYDHFKVTDIARDSTAAEAPCTMPETPASTDCQTLRDSGYGTSGAYFVRPPGFDVDVQVYCKMEDTPDYGWLVFQRRQDGSEDFYRDWNDYSDGFGRLSAEFWWGNEKLRVLTSASTWILRIELQDFTGETAVAEYTSFRLDGEFYTLILGDMFPGLAVFDNMAWNNGSKFSTYDRDNDQSVKGSCAEIRQGGWWYVMAYWCSDSNLNGRYYQYGMDGESYSWVYDDAKYASGYSYFNTHEDGVFSYYDFNYQPLAKTEMMIRPADNLSIP